MIPLALQRLRLTPAAVRELAERARPLTPEEVKRAALRHVRKARSGRKGLPCWVVETMYADYLRVRSLAKCGALHHRTRQSMYQIFKAHGKKLIEKSFFKPVVYKWKTYTPGKNGYLRCTSGARELLHVVIWEEANGKVPDGLSIKFKNGDRRDIRLGNLELVPTLEILARGRTGVNQFTPASERRNNEPWPQPKFRRRPRGELLLEHVAKTS